MVNSTSLQQTNVRDGFFSLFARWCEQQVARPGAAFAAIAFVALWLAVGPLYGWSNSWQLVINTSSSVITLVMVFVIQHTQRRDTQAIQLKLDELIRVDSEARNELISLEAKPEIAVEEVKSAFEELRETVEDHPPHRDAG
ncbi:MAG: low affinity iron permease family protein [Alphaproteobacteria bacterium]|nr:low affinity iron permease family protein [Alphaproteobacteria bacterium]MBV9154431.1 low affinity iron permease family protein [Alphaproteobacteria bacterium]MBV9967636.1 low affinity iron permease family protein [Alphaproteobacteria bacterium]